MGWNDLKRYLRDVAKPKTISELKKAICDFWKSTVSVNYCNEKIYHLYNVRKMVVQMKGDATGE
jgi:hypothetical protein